MQISESVILRGFHADLHNCLAYTKAMFANNLGVIKRRKFLSEKKISFMNILNRFNFFLGINATVGKSLSFRGQFISAREAKCKKKNF